MKLGVSKNHEVLLTRLRKALRDKHTYIIIEEGNDTWRLSCECHE